MYYLYAYTVTDDGSGMEMVNEVAFVEEYDTQTEAQQSRDVNMQCYSDDGIFFSILMEHPTPAANTTFFDLLQRYSK